MRERILNKLAHWHSEHPGRVLLISLIITVVMALLAGQLTMTMRTTDLLPENDPKVAQYNKIIDDFTTSVSTVILVQGPEVDIKRFADELAPKVRELTYTSANGKLRAQIADLQNELQRLGKKGGRQKKRAELQSEIAILQDEIEHLLYTRVDYKVTEDFIREHGLMLVEAADLADNQEYLSNPNLPELLKNLNDSMEKEYVGKEESISTREEEDGAVQFLDGIEGVVAGLGRSVDGQELTGREITAIVDRMLYGEPYFLSYDKQALIMTAIPNFTLMERQYFTPAVEQLKDIISEQLAGYPAVRVGLTGAVPKEYDEQVYGTQTIGSSTPLALLAILIILMFSFRMWLAPLMAITTLIVGVIWAAGMSWLLVQQLNMMTSIFSVILFGLGIDFSIHLITGFTQGRARGNSIKDALQQTYIKSGKGIITGGVTTACAFLSLMISQTRGMAELGIVIGSGLIMMLLATFVFLPTLLVYRERRVDRRRKARGDQPETDDLSFGFLGRLGVWLSTRPPLALTITAVLSAVLIWSALQIRWDTDFRAMEPEGIESMALIDTLMAKFDLSTDYALVTAATVVESRQLAEEYKELSSVARVEDISIFLPMPDELHQRQEIVAGIRQRMSVATVQENLTATELATLEDELMRLEMNIIEISDMAFVGGQDKVDKKCRLLVGDPDDPESVSVIGRLIAQMDNNISNADRLSAFQRDFATAYKKAVVRLADPAEIKLAELPESILERYTTPAQDQFLVTIYPAGSIYQGEFLYRFTEDVERVSPRVTGSAPLAVALLNIYSEDGRKAVLLTMLVVFVLLLIDFKRLSLVLMSMIPLALGVFWMVGMMWLAGVPLNMMSVIGLPLIIGIGIDDGVHIIHRWREEGQGEVYQIFAGTGKAIFLTSLTTMLAFGSMVFSVFPAYGHMGGSLFLGVGACFLTTMLVIPGLIGLVEQRKK